MSLYHRRDSETLARLGWSRLSAPQHFEVHEFLLPPGYLPGLSNRPGWKKHLVRYNSYTFQSRSSLAVNPSCSSKCCTTQVKLLSVESSARGEAATSVETILRQTRSCWFRLSQLELLMMQCIPADSDFRTNIKAWRAGKGHTLCFMSLTLLGSGSAAGRRNHSHVVLCH